jgi:hypothetical protein
LSALRIAALAAAILGLVVLAARRRGRLLGRAEVLAWAALSGLGAVAAFPSLAGVLTNLTGLSGDLARITSLLVVTVIALGVLLLDTRGELEENRATFFRYLRTAAVDAALPPGREVGPVSVAIVMPAYEEADNLPGVLARAPAELDGHPVRVIVVDDGSGDDTAAVAERHGAIAVRSPINAGGGHALHVGFLAAKRLGARWVVTMDADGQHRFEDLPTVMAPLFAGQAEVVVGSRHLGESVGHEAVRAIGLRVFNAVLSVVIGKRVTDCSSGYRGFDRASLERLRLVQRRHHTAELLIEATRKGLRVVEVPITILPRVHGESKKGTNWRYGFRFARTIVASWWGA